MNFKKQILLTSIITASASAFAEYNIIIPLDKSAFTLSNNTSISGSANLAPETINRGDSSTLSWNYKYADKVNIAGLGSYGPSGSVNVSPLTTTHYLVEAIKGEKTLKNELTLNVIQSHPEITFTTDTYKIGVGGSANLNWNVLNADSVDIDNGVGTSLAINSSINVSPTTSTTYTITANGYEGLTERNSLSIEVIPNSVINSFTSDKSKITVGDNVIFNWNVTDSEGLSLTPYGVVDKTKNTLTIAQNTVGEVSYQLKSESFSGLDVESSPITVTAYEVPVISSYKVNDSDNVNAEPNEELNFTWTGNNVSKYTLDGSIVEGLTKKLNAPDSGTKSYVLSGENEAGKSVNKTVEVTIVGVGAIDTFTAPSTVFVGVPFSLNWTASNVSDYKLSGTSNSGIGTETSVTGLNYAVTPITANTHTYTLKGTSASNKEVVKTVAVVVEDVPILTSFTVNNMTTVDVSPNAVLTFAGSGSEGSTTQARNITNNNNETLPANAPSTPGTYSYYMVATKTINSVTKYSTLKTVTVNVIESPTISSINAPSNVFANAPFSISWNNNSGTTYSISSDNETSGIATSPVNLDNSSTTTVTPTAAGTYNYTITATNSVGISTTSSKQVIVESDPTLTRTSVNGSTGPVGYVKPSTAFSISVVGNTEGSVMVGRDNRNTVDVDLPSVSNSTEGSTPYYIAVKKTLNGITRYSRVVSAVVIVQNDPVFTSISIPLNVFTNTAFSGTWVTTPTGNSYKIRSNNAASGIPTTDMSLSSSSTGSITPTSPGTYIYTITATNNAGGSTSTSVTVTVEAIPTMTGFTVNGGTAITVPKGTALTYAASGLSPGASLDQSTLSKNANSSVATTVYVSGYATKTLNGVTKRSTTPLTVTVTTQ